MARPETTGRKVGPTIERAVYTIAEFWRSASDQRKSSTFKIRNLGLGPRESRTLDKVLISNEAAADWRASREVETT